MSGADSPDALREAITWDGLDVIPYENGLVKRKDVYSHSVSILTQLGLLG